MKKTKFLILISIITIICGCKKENSFIEKNNKIEVNSNKTVRVENGLSFQPAL